MVWGKGLGAVGGKSEYEAVDNMCRFTFFLRLKDKSGVKCVKGQRLTREPTLEYLLSYS